MNIFCKSIALTVLITTIGIPAISQDSQDPKKSDNGPKSATGKALEKSLQLHRDSGRLDRIHKIALVPVITQVRFDKDNRIPDPARLLACVGAAREVPEILTASLTSGKYQFVPSGDVDKALINLNILPSDLYITRTSGSWESPAETVTGKNKDEAALLAKRDDMKRSRNEMTLFRYKWHENPDTAVGLASFDQWAVPTINGDKAKQLAAKLGVDALLFLTIYDVEVYEGSTGIIFPNKFKSTRTHVYGTLMSTDDGEILWKARARGVKSHQANYFHVGRMKGDLGKSVAEGTAHAVQMLLSDMIDGTGIPTKK